MGVKDGVNFCDQCGRSIPAIDVTVAGGRELCRQCAAASGGATRPNEAGARCDACHTELARAGRVGRFCAPCRVRPSDIADYELLAGVLALIIGSIIYLTGDAGAQGFGAFLVGTSGILFFLALMARLEAIRREVANVNRRAEEQERAEEK